MTYLPFHLVECCPSSPAICYTRAKDCSIWAVVDPPTIARMTFLSYPTSESAHLRSCEMIVLSCLLSPCLQNWQVSLRDGVSQGKEGTTLNAMHIGLSRWLGPISLLQVSAIARQNSVYILRFKIHWPAQDVYQRSWSIDNVSPRAKYRHSTTKLPNRKPTCVYIARTRRSFQGIPGHPVFSPPWWATTWCPTILLSQALISLH